MLLISFSQDINVSLLKFIIVRTILIFLFTFVFTSFLFSQVFINELDCDTPGSDDMEFVELLSSAPNFPLDGYVVVFFNGSVNGANTDYFAIDLDGYVTDINGLLLIGSSTVVPFPQLLISPNVIQNGADAVAIYKANDIDFELTSTAYVDNTLTDVLIYGTTDADATGLIDIFKAFNPDIVQINEGSANNTNSIQRFVDGTGKISYTATVPTPRQLNDGSGIILNGVLIKTDINQYDEGQSFDINITTEKIVTEALTLNMTLNNGSFNGFDYNGNINLIIPAGQNSVKTTISIIDDAIDEGDENMRISITGLPPVFLAINNNLQIRIVDNDFKMAAFGTPIKPTYGIVKSTQPIGYYNSLNGKAGTTLYQAMQDIVANPDIVRVQTYNDVIDILKEADQNPENSNQVWLVYLEKGRSKLDFQEGSSNTGKWNREHTFPRSRGGFFSIAADETIDGKDIYWKTNADSLRHGNSDAHALRVVDGPENSKRGNQFYGQYNGPVGTLGKFKGDVARSVFYMAIRYKALEIVKGFPEGMVGKFGDLDTLLVWHRNDPPDDFEMNRNNVVYTWQYNRNPFIDHPELIEYYWGNKMGEIWQQPSYTYDTPALSFDVYPNPTTNRLHLKGSFHLARVDVLSMDGRLLSSHQINNDSDIDLQVKPGSYIVKLSTENQSFSKKILVK